MRKWFFLGTCAVFLMLFLYAGVQNKTPVFGGEIKLEAEDIFSDHISVMLLIDPEDGRILDANAAASEFYGYSHEELLKMNMNEINTLSPDLIQAEMRLATEEKRNFFLFKHRLKNGEIRDVEVYSSPIRVQGGQMLLFSVIHDVSARMAAELEAKHNRSIKYALTGGLLILLLILLYSVNKSRMRENEAKEEYQNLFDNMKEGFALHEIICDEKGRPVDYIFLGANKAFEEITGVKTETAMGRSVKDIFPGTEEHWIQTYGEVALSGKTMSFINYASELKKHFNVSAFSPRKGEFAVIFNDVTEIMEAQERIQKERALLETVLDDAIAGYWDWDIPKNQEYLSPSLKAMFGYRDDEMENSPRAWRDLILEEDFERIRKAYKIHVQSHGEVPYYNQVRYRHKNGSMVWVLCSGRVVDWDDAGKPLRMVGCYIDITTLKVLEKQIAEERMLLKTTLHSIGDAVISTDAKGRIDIMNLKAQTLTGWSGEEAKGKSLEEVFSIVDEASGQAGEDVIRQVLSAETERFLDEETMLRSKNGALVPIEADAAPIRDETGLTTGGVIVFRDCGEKKKRLEKIRYLSYHDQLTGLYNRRFFEEEMERLNTEEFLPLTLAVADVNGLKLTNDAFGHLAGDELLRIVASVFRDGCRNGDVVARVGGDEFVMLFPKTDREKGEKILQQIQGKFSQMMLDNTVVSVSIGWEEKTDVEQPIAEIFSKAEDQMYHKKLTESQSMRSKTIEVILKTLNETNPREKIHSEKVAEISRRIGKTLNLSEDQLKEIELAALMHDIGKIAISNTLLNKPGRLTAGEFEEVKRHPEIGYHILKSVDAYAGFAEHALSHHERWDGTGYPRGIAGEEIPLIARIISVADALEAMTALRPYKKPFSEEEAFLELQRCAGTQFDPSIVKVFDEYAEK